MSENKSNTAAPSIIKPATQTQADVPPPAAPHVESVLPTASLSWKDMGLSPAALELIHGAGYVAPTAVQAEAIPMILAGEDLIASAQTGTGKTAAFVLPMVEKFAGREGTFGVILCPTREIALQTQATIEIFGTPRGVRSIALIGGVDMKRDTIAIQSYPQIIVATPGRLCDHLDRGNIWLDYIQVVVLDEADRMLDMGFADQLSRIMEDVPKTRQTLLFSATFPPTIERFARKILNEPKRVAIGKPLSAAQTVSHRLLWMKEESKNRELYRLIMNEPGSIIVFTRSKSMVVKVWRSLHSRCVYDATFISSDRSQDMREQALADFKSGVSRILIATDVAGRGIHVDGVAHVVNYDLPMEAEDYVHRIGRTGRAEATGKATSFATLRDRPVLHEIERILGYPIPFEFADQIDLHGRAEHRSSYGSGGGHSRGSHSRGGHSGSRSGQGGAHSGGRPPKRR